jgi:hypothetical protein
MMVASHPPSLLPLCIYFVCVSFPLPSFVCFLYHTHTHTHTEAEKEYLCHFLISGGVVRLSPLGTSTLLTYCTRAGQVDNDECGAVGGMRIGRRNQSTRRKPVPVPLCLPQIPHNLTWTETRAVAVGTRRLTVWAMALSYFCLRTAEGRRKGGSVNVVIR